MRRYIVKRLLLMIPTLFGVAVLVFFMFPRREQEQELLRQYHEQDSRAAGLEVEA